MYQRDFTLNKITFDSIFVRRQGIQIFSLTLITFVFSKLFRLGIIVKE